MSDVIDAQREVALDSTYSTDRREAIDELEKLFSSSGSEDKRRIVETLRQVALEATHRDERDRARRALEEAVETDPDASAPVVIPAVCRLATDAKSSDERLEAIDALRRLHREVGSEHREEIRETLRSIASDGTYERERSRARTRLTDVASDDATGGGAGDRSVSYLAGSLAEHLSRAARDSHEECLQRVEELRDFVAEHDRGDAAYEDALEDLDSLVGQLETVPADGDLDDDRIKRVDRVANRVRSIYARD